MHRAGHCRIIQKVDSVLHYLIFQGHKMALEYCPCMIEIRIYEDLWFSVLVDSNLQYKTHFVFSWIIPTRFNCSCFAAGSAAVLQISNVDEDCRWLLFVSPFFPYFVCLFQPFGILDKANLDVPWKYYAMGFFSTNQHLHGRFQTCQIHSKTCPLSRNFPTSMTSPLNVWKLWINICLYVYIHWGNWNGGLIAYHSTLKDALTLSY